jgi:predicted Zn finger-like uncharacterized protein
MIVVCENCKARFKFDERRLKPAGIKVHCSKCKHNFHLKPPSPPAEPSQEAAPPSLEWLRDSPRVDAVPSREEAVPPEAEPTQAAPPEAAPAEPAPPAPTLPEAPPPDADIFSSSEPGVFPDEAPAGAPRQAVDPAVAAEAEAAEAGEPGARPAEGGSARGLQEAWEEEAADPVAAVQPETPDPPGAGEPQPEEERHGMGEAASEAVPDLQDEDGDGFDWEHISFAERGSKPAATMRPRTSSDMFGGSDDEEKLELAVERRRPRSRGRSKEPASTSEPRDRARDSAGATLQLDLSKTADRRERPAEAGAIPEEAAAASAPAKVSRASLKAGAPQRRYVTQGVQPVGSRIRLQRKQLTLPRTASLAASGLLALTVAVISAFTLYASTPRIADKARPVGEAHPQADLAIDGAAGRTVERLDGGGLFVVTGKARWKGTVDASYHLEGVLVDSDGRILQRRAARLGSMPNWEVIEKADPLRFAGHAPLPPRGETAFTILFTPDSHWRATVRFELRAGG